MSKPGLPANFKLGVRTSDFEDRPPADLGDYLDEDKPPKSPPVAAAKPKRRRQKQSKVAGRIEPVSPVPPPAEPVAEEPITSKSSAPVRKGPRMQINMRPATQEKAEALLTIVQTHAQKDAKMSELFDALVAAAFEAKGELELGNIPARGRWGSPTAKVFTDKLKSAIQRAIVQNERHRG